MVNQMSFNELLNQDLPSRSNKSFLESADEYLDDEAIFMTLDEYKDNIILRKKWDYEGGRIISENMFKGCIEEINDDDWSDHKILSKEGVIRILNDIIHFLNIITKIKLYLKLFNNFCV